MQPTPSFPYRLLAKVGEGAMGEVFRAEDIDLGRTVAIKVVKLGHLAGEVAQSAIQRFLQEARAAAAIRHPNVPIVYRVGVEAGWPYIAMEWIEGSTLEALLDGGRRFSCEHACRLGIQVLGALDAAHAVGIVHRDIKPGNLMLTSDGHVKVTDFGIARVQGASALAHTQAGLVLGTPWYAAPEQLAGLGIDARADIYGVGCVLYEAVTGHAPYEANTIYELLAVIQSTPPPRPSEGGSDIPRAFDAIVQRALAKDPHDRFASAREMALELEHVVSPPTAARPPALARRGSAPTARRIPAIVVDGTSASAIIMAAVRTWPATPLGRQATSSLLARLFERPLHAAAFCGGVELGDAWLLVSDGLIYAAFDDTGGLSGDRVLESLPAELDATLRPVPDGLDPEIVPLLASVLVDRAETATLDASLTDLVGVAEKLAETGFDGALRFALGPSRGFALFRKGRRVLDLFGAGWPQSAEARPWEDWLPSSGTVAVVEELRVALPSISFRQQLRDLALEIVRPAVISSSSLRFDATEVAHATELRPRDESRSRLRRGDTGLRILIDADPAYAIARWLLAELSRQFEQYGRSNRWKSLVEPIETLAEVRLHQTIGSDSFDVVSYDARAQIRHVIDRSALGTPAAIEQFVARADAAKRTQPSLGAAILVAPRFDEASLETYLAALRGERRSFLDSLRHREGFRRVGRDGYHLLLVEDDGTRRRPLVPE